MNVQNIPRADTVVKAAFLPKRDMFLFFDYDQIELRFLAYYLATSIDDYDMANSIIDGHDLHQETADAIGRSRMDGKTVNFAITYGAGVHKIATQLGIPHKEAKAILEAYRWRWPGVKRLMDLLSERLNERGWIETYGGRPVKPEADYAALNYLIQGSAAVLMKMALVRIWKWLKSTEFKTRLVSVIHDEVILDAARKELDVLMNTVPDLMRVEDVSKIVPIECEASLSFESWATKRKWKDYVRF